MMYWRVCTSYEHVSLINSKPCWNCTTWRFIRRFRRPDYQRLKTVVKRTFDHMIKSRNFQARNERHETGAAERIAGIKRVVQRGRVDSHQWTATGQRSEGDNCSFRLDGNKCATSTPKSAPVCEPQNDGTQFSRSESPMGFESIWKVHSKGVPIPPQR